MIPMLVSCARRVNDSRVERSVSMTASETATNALCGQSGVTRLVETAFGSAVTVVEKTDAAGGRGTFSDVFRLELRGEGRHPTSVVAKLPAENANRHAAAAGGAYLREASAYRHLLPLSEVAAPILYTSLVEGRTAAFLLEDLTTRRRVDQIDGLNRVDALAVTDALRRLHRSWRNRVDDPDGPVRRLAVRRSSVAGFDRQALSRGLTAIDHRWPEVTAEQREAYRRLLANADQLVERFSLQSVSQPTLCHGDPRADNMHFADDGSAVLFDWQQIAVQFGEADLAWLAATSLTPQDRRAHHRDLLTGYGADVDRFRLGLVLPGLAALLLAQREADHARTRRFILTSLQRIAAALVDLEVPAIPA